MPGYLSLHQTVQSLTLKWTPNQLMNGYSEPTPNGNTDIDKSIYWAYALNINIDDIVYVHCHQKSSLDESGGTIILVGQDGVQRPPIHFPEGGHMSSFLGEISYETIVLLIRASCPSFRLLRDWFVATWTTRSSPVVATRHW